MASSILNTRVFGCPSDRHRHHLEIELHESMIGELYLRITDDEHNIYLDNGDTKYGKDHIRNRRLHTKVSWLGTTEIH